MLSVAIEIGTATPLRERMLVHDRNLYKIDHSSFQGEFARLPQDAPEVQDRPAAIATAIAVAAAAWSRPSYQPVSTSSPPYARRRSAAWLRRAPFSFPCSMSAISPRFWTILQSLYARARVNVNLELSRSGNGVRNRFRRPDGRGSGQFAESALDTLYVARNRGESTS